MTSTPLWIEVVVFLIVGSLAGIYGPRWARAFTRWVRRLHPFIRVWIFFKFKRRKCIPCQGKGKTPAEGFVQGMPTLEFRCSRCAGSKKDPRYSYRRENKPRHPDEVEADQWLVLKTTGRELREPGI